MKHALLVYKDFNNHINIGDYVQSLAAEQFLPKVDTYINRENLNEYDGPKTKLIMNGWFLHEPQNWPPADCIDPLFISFHLNSKAYEILDNPRAIEYFKRHVPIGCRDKLTADHLQKKGVEAYFSSCLTTTLGESYNYDGERKGIYFVDPYFTFKNDILSAFKYFIILLLNFRKIKIISQKLYRSLTFKNLLKTASFYLQYRKKFESSLLVNAEYVTHSIHRDKLPSEEERFKHAKYLINKYAKAKLVITTRIHCALPSIGLGTPVIYIDDLNKSKNSACRLDGLLQYFNVIQYDNGELKKTSFTQRGKISENSNIKNDVNINHTVSDLIKKCKDFLD